MGILLDARYHDQNLMTGEFYHDRDKYWSMNVYAAAVPRTAYNAELKFESEIRFEDIETEEFLSELYPLWVDRFEEEYGEEVDCLLYYDPELVRK